MMRAIIESSQRLRFLVVVIAAVTMFFGVTQLRTAPVDVLPEFELPMVEVQTEALGLSADEVESLITVNLEELLSGTSWLRTIRSQSVPGLSSILLVFEPGTNLMHARQLVQERLTLAYTLPNVSKPPVMLQPLSATSRVMIIGLTSKEVSLIQMSVLARWTIRPRLLGVPGAGGVARANHLHRWGRHVGVALDLFGSLVPRDRRVDRYPPTTARGPARFPHLLGAGHGPSPRRRRGAAPR
jgi:Cu/Ag efflux pump CusA